MADNVTVNSVAVATRSVTYSGDASQNAQVVGLVAFSGSDDAKTAADLPGDATNGLDVDVTRLPALVAGTATIGKVDCQIAGTAFDGNSGNKSAGTVRVVLATDQPALTNALLVTAAGDVAHDGGDSGNPVKVGGKAGTSFPTAVSTGDRTNLITDVFGRPMVTHVDFAQQIWKQVEATSTQTGTAIWTPTSGKKVVVTSMEITTGGTTAAVVTVWFGAGGGSPDTTFSQGTDQPIFRGEFAPSTTSRPGAILSWPFGRAAATADHVLRYTTSAGITIYITVYGYEI